VRATISFLDRVEVAAPCSAPWEEMTGDDRARFCDQCRKNVYNLSDMSRWEAEALVRQAGEQRTCIRFYRRADGTVLTDNCPVGLRKMRTAIVQKWAVAASLVATLFNLSGTAASANEAPKVRKHIVEWGEMAIDPSLYRIKFSAVGHARGANTGATKHKIVPPTRAKRHAK